ncbi:enoyl-CoA hydratase-related protein [Bacteroidia bacterium]|jgi:enoyl-CoA hydratase|nr:enoyl-CoA hydratase [Bacteroidota bacterium]MDB4173258.1 enoyl-CoA hydratase-related protein [Bacteroidia bacterium]
MYNNIISENQGVVQIITINREEKLNALNVELIQEIGQEVARLNKEMTVRGIILTGKGQKAFAAGADISEFANFGEAEAKEMSAKGGKVFTSLEESEIPIIAAVNGYALGGGCELTMACHVRIASDNALFGQPEVNLGVPPGYGGTQRLAQIIGRGRALDMLITAKSINAETALNYGLVTQVVSQEELLPTCIKYIEKLVGKSPLAIAEVIKCTNELYENINGLQYEIDSFARSFQTADFKEGTTAFLEKRKPDYT